MYWSSEQLAYGATNPGLVRPEYDGGQHRNNKISADNDARSKIISRYGSHLKCSIKYKNNLVSSQAYNKWLNVVICKQSYVGVSV